MKCIDEIISNAISSCLRSEKGNRSPFYIIEQLKTQNIMLHSRFRYSIASEVSAYILSNYGNLIKCIKLYGSTMEYNAGKYSDIDMLLHVRMMNDSIIQDIKDLNYRLTCQYYRLIGEVADSYTYLMDIHFINDLEEKSNPSRAYLEHILCNESVAV